VIAISSGEQVVRFEQTSSTGDLNGQWACNSWIDAINPEGPFPGTPFDVIVVGVGMHGGYCAEKIYRFAKGNGKNLRILMLDAGSLYLTPNEPASARTVTSNLNDQSGVTRGAATKLSPVLRSVSEAARCIGAVGHRGSPPLMAWTIGRLT
jgi:hypothetical protein